MTVDREQIRRDAAKWVHNGYRNISSDLRVMSEYCLALLDELEQATSEITGLYGTRRELLERAEDAEARLEALRFTLDDTLDELERAERERDEARVLLGINVDDAGTTWHGAIAALRTERKMRLDRDDRLSRVPALVEAAKRHKCKRLVRWAGDIGDCPYCKTIAAFKGEQ